MEQRCGNPAAPLKPQTGTSRPDELTDSLNTFMCKLDRAFTLPRAQRLAVRNDFTRGIDTLCSRGVPFLEILKRLDPGRLRDFYMRSGQEFYPLDNGAKQYPIAMINGRMAMFRLTAVLDMPADPVMLQLALVFTLRRFPHYATRLRRGAFWYYLKPHTVRYAVQPDTGAMCTPIDVADETQALFRVLYQRHEVSVEMLHVLSDGMGGMMFLKTLLTEYYRLLGEDLTGEDPQALDPAGPSLPEDVENGFDRFRSRIKGDGMLASPAIRIPAEHLPAGECRVDRYEISAAQLRKAARVLGVSVTALMSAVILTAARETAKAAEGRYQLQVTADLRRVFQSRTLRNFSWFGALRVDANANLYKADLAHELHTQLRALTERSALERNASAAQRMIRLLRYVPLQWKTLILRSVYRITGDYFFTATLSNLGVIALHGPLQRHMREIAVILGPSPSNPYSFALATVRDRAILCVTRTTDDLTMRDRLMDGANAYGLSLIQKG